MKEAFKFIDIQKLFELREQLSKKYQAKSPY